jgi:hypothetical protein
MRLLARLLTATALVGLLTAPSAGAAGYDPVASGSTTLTLAPSFVHLLHSSGVKLEGKGGVRVRGAAISFPLSGGKLEPVEAKGTIEHAGQLVFRSGNRKLPLKALQLKTTRATSPFAAKLGGGQLKLSTAAKLTSARKGFGTFFKTSGMLLSAKAATRLDKKLGLKGVFEAGQQFASATTAVEPATVGLAASGKVELSIDPGFAAKLGSLFVAVNPIFPAEHPGAFTFPIGGGVLAPDGSSGSLQTTGAIELLQLGGGQVILREPFAELGSASAISAEAELLPSPPYPGKLGRMPAFALSGGAFSAEPAARTLALSAAAVALTAGTAAQLNEAFAKPQGKADVFAAGEALGTLTFATVAE